MVVLDARSDGAVVLAHFGGHELLELVPGTSSLEPIGGGRGELDFEAERGEWTWRFGVGAQATFDGRGLLITILIGNNLAVELASRFGESIALRLGVAPGWKEVIVTLALTPFLFLFAELVPKDLFRRRPHALTPLYAPFLALSKLVYLPLALPLRGLSRAVERRLRLSAEELEAARGRLAFLSFLAEGAAAGAVTKDVERMVHNAFALAETPVTHALVAWPRVLTVRADRPEAELREAILHAPYSRLPVVEDGPDGPVVRRYVLQLDVLGAEPGVGVLELARPLPELGPDVPIDRALGTLRKSGQRVALVGTAEAPLGLVTLKDLVEEISGELDRW